MRTTTVTVPGNPRRYIDALDEAVTALEPTNPAAAHLLADVARSIDQVRREQVALRALARVHRPMRATWGALSIWCEACMNPWPCKPAQHLQRAGFRFPGHDDDHPQTPTQPENR